MGTSTLLSMLGGGITDRSKFQWIKLFGRENVFWDKSKEDLPLVSREYITKVFYESKENQRTSDALANVMLYAYYGWVCKPENSRISGVIAEEIHNRVMKSIATYWKRPWQPEKHKCPIYGILNLFNIVRRYVQSDLLPLGGGTKRAKGKADRLFVDSWFTMPRINILVGEGEKESVFLGSIEANHPVLDWDQFHQETPLEILIYKEMRTSNEV